MRSTISVSYFTPSHKPHFLERAYASLSTQTREDWEWVILLNGAGSGSTLSDKIVGDSRVKVIDAGPNKQEIGRLKKVAAMHCNGEIWAELDHDDELSSNCTERLADVFLRTDADFVYSNCAEVDSNGPRTVYPASAGWKYSPVVVNGRNLVQTHSFPPSPSAFSRIWYAPNHIRAWNSKFYRRIGGHNPAFDILDDQELLIKTYKSGKVVHIDECLYIYNVHGENTWLDPEINKRIQSMTMSLYHSSILDLAAAWSDKSGLKKIDICCWKNKVRPDFIGVDYSQPADVVADLNGHWPFEDGSVGVIHAQDALEHMHNAQHTMEEIHRVLAPGGWLISSTPSTDGRGAFQDPTHVSFWNINSFWYYTRAEQAQYIRTPVRFQAVDCQNYFPSEWHRSNNIPYVRADLMKVTGLQRSFAPGNIDI